MSTLDQFLQGGDVLHVAVDGQMTLASVGRCPPATALLPGSFNPVHHGHWELARVAERILGCAVSFEISVTNVDKPMLDGVEIAARLQPFQGRVAVWLTHAPLFLQKAERFPGAIFVIGADTAERLVAPRYYGNDLARLESALARIRELNCRFLVACRADGRGQCLRVEDMAIPPAFAELFQAIPPEQFRWDISSSQLRAQGATR